MGIYMDEKGEPVKTHAAAEAALTPEQWALALEHGVGEDGLQDYLIRPAEQLGYGDNSPAMRIAVAALCLKSCEFFTWEDVDAIRSAVSTWTGMRDDGAGAEYVGDKYWPRLETLADRIAALLPPRPTA